MTQSDSQHWVLNLEHTVEQLSAAIQKTSDSPRHQGNLVWAFLMELFQQWRHLSRCRDDRSCNEGQSKRNHDALWCSAICIKAVNPEEELVVVPSHGGMKEYKHITVYKFNVTHISDFRVGALCRLGRRTQFPIHTAVWGRAPNTLVYGVSVFTQTAVFSSHWAVIQHDYWRGEEE